MLLGVEDPAREMLPKVPVSHWWRVCAEALERFSQGEGKCA